MQAIAKTAHNKLYKVALRGSAVLTSPRWNKGTAFTADESTMYPRRTEIFTNQVVSVLSLGATLLRTAELLECALDLPTKKDCDKAVSSSWLGDRIGNERFRNKLHVQDGGSYQRYVAGRLKLVSGRCHFPASMSFKF